MNAVSRPPVRSARHLTAQRSDEVPGGGTLTRPLGTLSRPTGEGRGEGSGTRSRPTGEGRGEGTFPVVWPTAGGSGTRSGLFPHNVRLRDVAPRQLGATGAVQASVVFDAVGRTFIADMAGAVQAYAPTEELLWRVTLPGGIAATPAMDVVGGRLFVGTLAGTVHALDPGTGSTLWQRELPTASDPRILSDLLYLPSSGLVLSSSWGGRFRALEAATGIERASWDAGISPSSAASANEAGTIYCLRAVSERGTELLQLDPSGGEDVLHRVGEGQRGARRMLTTAAPVVDERRRRVYAVFNPDRGALLIAWSVQEGLVAWTCPLPHSVQATPTLDAEGRLWLPDLAGQIQRVSPQGNVEAELRVRCEYLLAGGVCDAAGRFYLGDPWGRVNAFDPAGTTGHLLFEAPRSLQGRPAFGPDGALYVPGTDRHVYVFPGQTGNASPT